MDITVKSILGESDQEEKKPTEQEKEIDKSTPSAGTRDAEIDELSNLWNTGNKGEVVRRFMEMDNETSVKLVFAIGEEGALDLARKVDQMLEMGEQVDDELISTETPAPAAGPAPGAADYVSQVIGKEPIPVE